ncbi:hypothetical protein [Paenibacillus pini]|uniref:Uncharacterized protein n=1 Tax=Paenibacillus pini JCM 16418 TaxID=1236976 RepID=W7YWU5_9BACL|nr:hypothetical protein [Paenibacillus pini]GAF09126.1 hypothetical protein JCM16418_3246 [Paenibacillus pini JCM 16418]
MPIRKIRIKPKQIISWVMIVLIVALFLLYAFVVVNDKPGGLSDWRMSRVIGLKSTIRIPIGKTPDEAVQKFRMFSSMDVIHRERVDGGSILFINRSPQKEGSYLQVEYVRETWLGWKWVWGGGYGIGKSDSPQAKPALNYMSMPEVENVSTPFPIVFGDILDSSIKNVTVESKSIGKHKAKLSAINSEKRIWFVLLPSLEFIPFVIKGFNEKGELLAFKTITDPRDMGLIDLRK